MSCLSDCGCKRSDQDIETAEERTAHVESSYQPLLEASNAPEAIPLLPKEPAMHKYEAQQQQYQLLALIGIGLNQAAQISLARHLPSGHHVAIRRIDLEICSEDIKYVQHEILLTRQLRHENLLPYYNSFVTGCHVWVVMPLMNYGSAQSLLKGQFPEGLPEIAIAFILKDVLAALLYLHKRGFIHRSIRASHILLNGNGRAVLGGLRYSCNIFQGGRWQSNIHTYPHDSKPNLNWLSPELLHQNMMGYSAKSDMYSVGVTSLELRNGMVPFAHLGPTQMLLEKLAPTSHSHHSLNQPHNARNLYSTTENNSLLVVDSNGSQGFANHQIGKDRKVRNINENHSSDGSNNSVYINHVYSEAFSSFVNLCLRKDPVTRPSAGEMLTHMFIKQCKKSQISMMDVLAKASHLIEKFGKVSVAAEDEVEVPVERLETFELSEAWSF